MNLPGRTHYAFRPASFSGGEAATGRFGTLPLLRVFCRFRGSDRRVAAVFIRSTLNRGICRACVGADFLFCRRRIPMWVGTTYCWHVSGCGERVGILFFLLERALKRFCRADY